MPYQPSAPFFTLTTPAVLGGLQKLTGSPFGTLSSLAAAFDGVTSQAAAACASGGAPAYFGLTLPAPTQIIGARIYGSNNAGYLVGVDESMMVELRGKNSPPTGGGDGVLLGSLTFTDTANESAFRQIDSVVVVPYEHVWINIFAGINVLRFAELEIYGDKAASGMGRGGYPITDSELGAPATVLLSGGIGATIVAAGGTPVRLLNADGSRWVP